MRPARTLHHAYRGMRVGAATGFAVAGARRAIRADIGGRRGSDAAACERAARRCGLRFGLRRRTHRDRGGARRRGARRVRGRRSAPHRREPRKREGSGRRGSHPVSQPGSVYGRPRRGERRHAVPVARLQPEAAPQARAGAQARGAHRLALARHGRLAAARNRARDERRARAPGLSLGQISRLTAAGSRIP